MEAALLWFVSIFLSRVNTVLSQDATNFKPPHILFILADDLGWSDVGFHGSVIETPNIDKLARQGVILDNYYVQPLCTPTRSALMTGRYPIHTGLQHGVIHPDNPYGLPLEYSILPQELKKVGYATHLVGKWHLGFYKWPYIPTKRGFDTAFGFWDGSENHYSHSVEGFLDFHDGEEPSRTWNGTYATYAYMQRAERIVRSHDPAKPLFLYMAFQNVHSPVQAPQKYVDKYKFIEDNVRRTYAGMVDILDEAVGNLTRMFQEAGLWDDTLVIFSTDNGGLPDSGGYNWPLRGTKHTVWEGGARGTAFVYGNLLKQTGVRSKELMHVTDWYPTLIKLAGGSFDPINPKPVDGFDVWETISTGKSSPRKELVINIDSSEGASLRVGDMKILLNVPNVTWYKPPELEKSFNIKHEHQKQSGADYSRERLNSGLLTYQQSAPIQVALYNITADPNEHNDLSNSSKYLDVVAKLKKRMVYYVKSMVQPLNKPSDPQARVFAEKNGCWGPWQ
ncbi:arylsulfatase B-like [Montipora capricornis]|uniref:arylsulfatase B-like n=1 Tax=Montipora capricornis TaxID=246305 RepID=UPI0035F19B1E